MKRFFYALLLVSLAFLFSCASGGRDIRLAERSAAQEVDVDSNGRIDIPFGGSNGGTPAEARTNFGLGNVDNTSDADKPISTATQAALDDKQPTMGADDNYVTDAEKTVIGNTSGVNTGDQTDAEIETAYNNQVGQVSEAEKNAGTETGVRRFSPGDVKDMIDTHGGGGSATVEDTAYGATWNGDTDSTSKNTIYDYLVNFDADADGDFTDEPWFPSTSGAPTNATYLTTTAEAGLSAETVVSTNGLALITAADLGTFSGDIIPDNQTVKQAIQALETEMGDTVSISTNGLIARTGDGTAAARTITAGTGLSVTNGDGVSGNPTVAIADTAVTPGSYTNANITVDAQGRVTAAGNGSTGGVSAYESGTECDFHGTILNPQGVYDNDATNHAVTIVVNAPAAFTISGIYISCDADPTTEPTLTFQHKTAGVGYGTPTTIEAVTTTAGVASITSGIDSASISAGSKVFVTLSDPDDALTEISWQLKGVYN